MKIEKNECNYQVTECELKFREPITLDGELFASVLDYSDTTTDILEQAPCSDSISRQAVLDYIYNDLGLGDEENGNDVERQMELDKSYRYIESLPPVNPMPKMGHWIIVENWLDVGKRVKCSECRHIFVVGDEVSRNFCGHCGAKMVELQSESKE